MKGCIKQRCIIQLLYMEKIVAIGIQQDLLNIYRPNSGYEHSSKVGHVFHSDVCDMPHSRCFLHNSWNEKHLNQFLWLNYQIMNQGLCIEMNVGFTVMGIKKMLVMLGYCKVCARWVTKMFTEEQKDKCKSVRTRQNQINMLNIIFFIVG